MNNIYKKKIPNSEGLFKNSFVELSMMMEGKLKFEKLANCSNFDSGIPLEDYFREEFSKFIPKKYSVCSATIMDRENYTCGECDFIIYDDQKSVFIKHPSTNNSRRKFLFHEATYGIIEVKQTLTIGKKRMGTNLTSPHYEKGTLHNALEKLFSYKQLDRENYINDAVIAVRPGTDEGINLTNEPFSYAFFYDTDIDISIESERKKLIREFYFLNMRQPVKERVNGIFVLNKFFIAWQQPGKEVFAYWPPNSDTPSVAMGMSKDNTLYFLYILLANFLRTSEVTVPIFNRDYGGSKFLKTAVCNSYSGT